MHTAARRNSLKALSGLLVALVAASAWTVAPALSSRPWIPDPVDFELGAPLPPTAHGGARAVSRYTSPVLSAPKRFTLVGMRWRGAGLDRLALRVRSPSGRWSPWTAVPAGQDDGPDRKSRESRRGWRVSDPVWAGEADRVQYRARARGPVHRLRLHFVNTRGTATPLERLRSKLRRTASGAVAAVLSLAGTGAAQADGVAPPIVSRDQWGASKCPPRVTPEHGTVKVAFVHHTVTANDYGPEDSAGIVLGICRYHRNSNGWNDIGYNFLVDRFGTVFEGRAGGVEDAVVGAQAQGYNSQSTGVASIGNFSTAGQSDVAIGVIARLLRWKLALHGVPPTGTTTVVSQGGALNRYPAGATVELDRISGHRDADATACPGDALYAQLPLIRAQAAGIPVGKLTRAQLRAAHRHIRFGEKAEMKGSLATLDGQPLGGRRLALQFLGTSGWRPLQSITTDASGAFATRVRLSYNRAVRALFAGEGELSGSRSTAVGIGVRPRVTARLEPHVSDMALPRGGRLLVRAQVRPSKRSALLIVSRRAGDGSYRRVVRKVLKLRRGKAAVRQAFPRTGAFRLQVLSPADPRNLAARSQPITVDVR